MKKIGLFSGTFDPIHYGHLRFAECALFEVNLDKVIFLPTAVPPHKISHVLTPIKFRKKMVELAISGNKKFELNDYESKKTTPCYTCDTIEYFKRKTNSDIYFLIGSDSLLELHSWKMGYDLLDLCKFIIGIRPESDLKNLPENVKSKVIMLKSPMLEISASAIRELIKTGNSVRYLLPEKVIHFIKSKKLYR